MKILIVVKNFISNFLNRSNFLKRSDHKVLKKGDSVFLRVPENIPREILVNFTDLFKKYKNIHSAYLAEGFLEAGETPHFIIGLSISGIETNSLMEKMAEDVHEMIPNHIYVDFIVLNDDEPSVDNTIVDFMKNYLIPFYTRD